MSSDNELSVTYLLTGTPKVSFILRPLEQAKSHRLEFYATSILKFLDRTHRHFLTRYSIQPSSDFPGVDSSTTISSGIGIPLCLA